MTQSPALSQQTLSPGVTLAAGQALIDGRDVFTSAQVAYLMHLAYRSGLETGRSQDQAEMLATWAEHIGRPPTRQERIDYEVALAGPVKYHGGDISERLLAEWGA